MKLERFFLPLSVILLWQVISFFGIVPDYLLPSPLKVLLGFRDLLNTGMPPGHLLQDHVLYSLGRVVLGFMVAALIGIPLGLFMGWFPLFRLIISPAIEMVRPIPPLAWIPIAILWFGIGIKSAAFIIFLGAFFPILLNTISGVLSINPIMFDAARTLHAGNRDIFFKVLLPGAIPSIFVGMRIGVGIGWMTLVAAEFTGVRQGYGLGYMIMTARDVQRADEILAGMLVIGLIGLLINGFLRICEKRIIRWQ